MFFSRPAGLRMTSRGDPTEWDKAVGDFTIDSSYHDWDLSSIIGKGTGIVRIRGQLKNGTALGLVKLRKNGNSNELNICSRTLLVVNENNEFDFTVENDANGIIEYNISSGGAWVTCNMLVVRWFK